MQKIYNQAYQPPPHNIYPDPQVELDNIVKNNVQNNQDPKGGIAGIPDGLFNNVQPNVQNNFPNDVQPNVQNNVQNNLRNLNMPEGVPGKVVMENGIPIFIPQNPNLLQFHVLGNNSAANTKIGFKLWYNELFTFGSKVVNKTSNFISALVDYAQNSPIVLAAASFLVSSKWVVPFINSKFGYQNSVTQDIINFNTVSASTLFIIGMDLFKPLIANEPVNKLPFSFPIGIAFLIAYSRSRCFYY